MIDELDLIDIWRDHNPELRNFTWRRNTPRKQARLDFFLISDFLYSDVIHLNIQRGYRTYHSMISVTYEFNDINQHCTYWKFNNSLLKNKTYVDIINKVITDVKIQYAALVYNMDAIENIPLEDINQLLF